MKPTIAKACLIAWTLGIGLGATLARAQDVQITAKGRMLAPAKEAITCLRFSGDGKLLSGDGDGFIHLWEPSAQRLVTSYRVKSKDKVLFLGFLSGDQSFVAVDEGRNITVFDLASGQVKTSFQVNAKPLLAAMDPGKQFLAVSTKKGYINIFDLKAGMPFGEIDARNKIDNTLFLGFDRLGQQLLAIDKHGKVINWNASTLKVIREMELAGGSLHGSSSEVFSAATNRAANVFAVGIEEFAKTRGGPSSAQRNAETATGGQAGAGLTGAVAMPSAGGFLFEDFAIAYDWSTGMELKRVRFQESPVLMAMGPGNDHIAVTEAKGNRITLVDLRKGETAAAVSTPGRPQTLIVSDDDRHLAAGMKDGQILVWDLGYRGSSPDPQRPNLPSLAGRVRTTTGTEPALKQGEARRLAILNFEGKGVDQSVADICLDSLTSNLANRSYLTLVERKQIQALLGEQKIQASGLTDEATSVQLGRLLNADHVLTCSIGRLGSTMVLTARLLNVETGKVMQGREVICEECRDQDIFDAVRMLATTIAQ